MKYLDHVKQKKENPGFLYSDQTVFSALICRNLRLLPDGKSFHLLVNRYDVL